MFYVSPASIAIICTESLVARIFIYAETPEKSFTEGVVDRESGEHIAEQLGEQVVFAQSINDVPKLHTNQTRISIMGHGLRDRMAFWDSPEACFN